MKSKCNNLVKILKEKNLKIAFAESCTGGLLAKLVTDVPGCSDIFECGIVSYSNDIKHSVLKVKSKTLENFGAVSENTVMEMTEGLKKISGCDIAVSVSGIAGPTGGTKDKKVGLIYYDIYYKNHNVFKAQYYDEKLSRDDRRNMIALEIFDKVIKIAD